VAALVLSWQTEMTRTPSLRRRCLTSRASVESRVNRDVSWTTTVPTVLFGRSASSTANRARVRAIEAQVSRDPLVITT
jgi:hypothetical protein